MTTPASPKANQIPVAGELSAKDLKALKKAEKANKRAAQKAAAGLPPRSDVPNGNSSGAHGGGNSGGAHGGAHSGAHGGSHGVPHGSGGIPSQVKGIPSASVSTSLNNIKHDGKLSLFGHLARPGRDLGKHPKEVHPAIVLLSLQFSSYKIIGSTARCRAMLEGFKEVINDYTTPQGTSLPRNLTTHLSHQIDYLTTSRPLSISMGNAIRWLKKLITELNIDLSDSVAKTHLNEQIDLFIRDRLDIAGRAISDEVSKEIIDGDVVLTYASSSVVKSSLIQAFEQGKKFSVIIVDSRPLFEGKKLLSELVDIGLSCQYVYITALSYVMSDVTKVLLGAHAMLSNGLLYSRIGTAMVATCASSRDIPVTVLCEAVKFTDRVQLDSVTFNELASSDSLLNLSPDPQKAYIKSPLNSDSPSLALLNILYDLTGTAAIKRVITEVGSLPPSAVPVILREYKY